MELKLLMVAAIVVVAFLYWVLSTLVFTHARFHHYHRKRRLHYTALGPAGWAAFYGRTVASAFALWWWWWRARLAGGLRTPSGEPSGPPVLAVHGFHMDGTCMWGIRRTLEKHGRATQAVSLGLPYRSADVYARSLTRAIRSLTAAAPGEQIDVVAHSMGGVVLRLVLAQSPELAAKIRRAVTLGSPHGGTGVLQWIRFGPVYRMMGRGSPFLLALPSFEQSAPAVRLTTIASRHDLIVYPVETAHLPGARQVTVEGLGHLGMLTDASLRDRVAEILNE